MRLSCSLYTLRCYISEIKTKRPPLKREDADFHAIAGRKVRLAADIKRAGVVGKGGGLSFVSSGSSLTDQAPIVDKFIEGTNDWRREEIVIAVPRSVSSARVGFALEGSGKIWVDNFVFEIVPN